jgi:hypothetical protein
MSTQDPKEDAYMEVFLLMLQSRQETPTMATTPPTVRAGPFAKGFIQQSKVQIDIGN